MYKSVTFSKGTVTKTDRVDLMRVEVEKTRQAGLIGERTNLFRVPKILHYDEAKGVCVLERLSDLYPIVSIIYDDNAIVKRVAQSLAAIHDQLRLPMHMVKPLPGELNYGASSVFIHGDFNGQNVCIERRSGTIVVLDWQMTSRHGGEATYGCRYYDVVWFVNYLLWTPTLRHLVGDPVTRLAASFVQEYFAEAGVRYDREEMAWYARAFFRVKRQQRMQTVRIGRQWLIARCERLTERFIDALGR